MESTFCQTRYGGGARQKVISETKERSSEKGRSGGGRREGLSGGTKGNEGARGLVNVK